MKLLLTSNGLSNPTITKAFLSILPAKPEQLRLAFIPTATDMTDDNKSWLVDDLANIKKLNFKLFDIVDISAIPVESAFERLTKADILFFGGGNPFYLMYWLRKTKLDTKLRDLLKTRVYGGISAGSMVVGKRLAIKIKEESKPYIDQNFNDTALNLVNFNIIPHLNSGLLSELDRTEAKEDFYALDDNSAILVEDNKIEVISEGNWKHFN